MDEWAALIMGFIFGALIIGASCEFACHGPMYCPVDPVCNVRAKATNEKQQIWKCECPPHVP